MALMGALSLRSALSRSSADESPHDSGQAPQVTLEEFWLLYWTTPTLRTGDAAADEQRARARSASALPRVRKLIALIEARRYAQGRVERIEPGTTLHDKARHAALSAAAALDDELEWALRAGLEARVGFMLVEEDLVCFEVVRTLRSNPYAPLPPGIAVCNRCQHVFKPGKTHAAICSFCDRRPHAQGRPGSIVQNEDGSFTVNSVLHGIYHQRTCLGCGDAFQTPQGRRCCSDTCDKRWRRAGKPDEPLRNPYEEWMQECFGDCSDLREEFDTAWRSALAAQTARQLWQIREFVATHSDGPPSWEQLEEDRRAVRLQRETRPPPDPGLQ